MNTCWQKNESQKKEKSQVYGISHSKPVQNVSNFFQTHSCRSCTHWQKRVKRRSDLSSGTMSGTWKLTWKPESCFSLQANFLFCSSCLCFSRTSLFHGQWGRFAMSVFSHSSVVLSASLISHMTGTGKEERCISKQGFSQSLTLGGVTWIFHTCDFPSTHSLSKITRF